MVAGLMGAEKRCLVVSWDDTGLDAAGFLEISKLTSQLFSLPLLQEPSVSFLRLTSFDSLPFRDSSCSMETVKT